MSCVEPAVSGALLGLQKKCRLSEAAARFILRNGSRCYDGDGCKSRVKYTAVIPNHLFGTTVKTDDKSRCADVEAVNTQASLELLENRGLGETGMWPCTAAQFLINSGQVHVKISWLSLE